MIALGINPPPPPKLQTLFFTWLGRMGTDTPVDCIPSHVCVQGRVASLTLDHLRSEEVEAATVERHPSPCLLASVGFPSLRVSSDKWWSGAKRSLATGTVLRSRRAIATHCIPIAYINSETSCTTPYLKRGRLSPKHLSSRLVARRGHLKTNVNKETARIRYSSFSASPSRPETPSGASLLDFVSPGKGNRRCYS